MGVCSGSVRNGTLSSWNAFSVVAQVSIGIGVSVGSDGFHAEFPAQLRNGCVAIGHCGLCHTNLGFGEGKFTATFPASGACRLKSRPLCVL